MGRSRTEDLYTLRRARAWLTMHFPPPEGVVIGVRLQERLAPAASKAAGWHRDGYYGQCVATATGFHITLSRRRCPTAFVLVDTLCHEWAHALAWQAPRDQQHHPDEFWLAYGRMYRLLVDEDGYSVLGL